MGNHDAANDETAFQRHADEFVFRAERHPDQLLQDDRQSECRQQRFSDLAVQPADQRQFDQRAARAPNIAELFGGISAGDVDTLLERLGRLKQSIVGALGRE